MILNLSIVLLQVYLNFSEIAQSNNVEEYKVLLD